MSLSNAFTTIANYGTQSAFKTTETCIENTCISKKTSMIAVIGCEVCSGVTLEAIATMPYLAPTCLSGPFAILLTPVAAVAGIVSCIGAGCLYLNLPDDEEIEMLNQQIAAEARESERIQNELQKKIDLYNGEIEDLNIKISNLESELNKKDDLINIEIEKRNIFESRLTTCEKLNAILSEQLNPISKKPIDKIDFSETPSSETSKPSGKYSFESKELAEFNELQKETLELIRRNKEQREKTADQG